MNRLRKCQLLQLKIAKEIVRICNENHIPYFLVAGSLLGAVRHKGFIPWDDDMDIGMKREDYNRFIALASKQMKEDFFLQTWDVEKEYGSSFAKIRLNETLFVEKNSEKANIHKGIYVDVFPFDNVPDNSFQAIMQRLSSTYYKHLLLNKCRYDYVNRSDRKKMLIVKFLKTLSIFYSYECIHKRYLLTMTKYNSVETKRVIAFGGANLYKKELLKREWVEKLTPLLFEGESFLCPMDYDAYLTHFYGDYMTPPPDNIKYQGHGIVKMSFGKYDFDMK